MAEAEKNVMDDQVQEDVVETSDVVEEQEEVVEEVDVPKKLVAIYPILYLSHQYKVGEILPANNPVMVEAWLEAGTAKWITDETNNKAKAQPRTAEPGQPGVAVASESENGENLAGKVPKTPARKKK